MGVENLSVIGLGKLGLCLAVCLADRGHHVVAVDISPYVLEKLNNGESPIYEPGLLELVSRCRGRMITTDSYRKAIENSQITFVVLPTPSKPDGSFSTAYLEEALERLGGMLRGKHQYHLFVITSTVLPGTTRNVLRLALEKASGKVCGTDFGLCYSPLLVALGSVIHNILRPDLVMIGESDERSGAMLEEVYKSTCTSAPPIVRASFESIELAKIGINSFITMKISFANTLAELCEHFPEADVDIVSYTLGLDSRIRPKYLQGGLGFGGPCFPRDNRAFVSVARQCKSEAPLAEGTDRVNDHQVWRVVQRVRNALGTISGRTIAVLGVTYKPNTNVTEESHALRVAEALRNEGGRLRVYDPAGTEGARSILGDGVAYCSSARDCLRGADMCLLGTPWNEFSNLRPEDFREMASALVFDCWRLLRHLRGAEGICYIGLGLPTMDAFPTTAVEPLERLRG
jgi:UDPglucose 6-dehydrogenase